MSSAWRASAAAFLVGVALALAWELSVGLLLYTSQGFVRALTVILAAGLGGLGLGLATGPTGPGPEAGSTLRRRWLLVVGAFGVAALVAWVGSGDGSVVEGAWRRGVDLALLTVLPLYAGGVLLAGLAGEAATPHAMSRPGIGASAVFGAAVGVTLQGVVFLGRFEPVSTYLVGVVLLSCGALIEAGPGEADGTTAPAAADRDSVPLHEGPVS